MSNYAKRDIKDYGLFSVFMQWLVCDVFYGAYLRLMFDIDIQGRENMPKENNYIVAANHISGRDPFILASLLGKSVAFMAKEELFETFFSKILMVSCGAFAVKRDKVAPSTIKTALSISKTKYWILGIFPQGTRDASDKVEKITRGFTTFAKATKSGILPVSIIGSDKKGSWPFSNKLTVKIGEIIPYCDDLDLMMRQWCESISKATGKEYKLADA